MGTCGCEGVLFAIFDVVGVDAVDGVEELRILLCISRCSKFVGGKRMHIHCALKTWFLMSLVMSCRYRVLNARGKIARV